MSSAILHTALADNLSQLSDRNAELAKMIREIEPCSGLEFHDTPQGVPAATLGGRQLCSRHRPLDEASRLAGGIDLLEHAVVVALGFGLGYHIRDVAERMGRRGLIVIFEPDVALLRAVFEHIDHSAWLGNSQVLFVTDAADSGALAAILHNCEALLAQGVAFLEHPASSVRLGEQSAVFTKTLTDHMTAAKVTMLTTLTRTVDTVRNLLLNFDHYVAGEGIAELKNLTADYPAVLVSAGPSLQRNVHLLSQPGVRDRCVVIAVQTVLKPLLRAGIKPHFVTALDFHELSGRFYEGLTPGDVEGVTLVAEPKVHPSVLDLFPGTARCIGSKFLDRMMGEHARDMGELPAGSTVAHLSLYLAKHLGCNPIAMIGQDLGFPDGLYYAPGNAVHDVWAPELNPFNTLEMMEWQRIRRFHLHLHKTVDREGKTIYSDAQMMTYLRQFERDFHQCKREGITIIDATEGGVPKRHSLDMPLREVLEKHATRDLPEALSRMIADAHAPAADDRCAAVRSRIAAIRRDITTLRETSRQTAGVLHQMLEDQRDAPKMARHFKKIDRLKREVEVRMPAFELLSHINQLGVFKRMKADRRLEMSSDLSAMARQRAEIQRDLENVTWCADAATEMIDQLIAAENVLTGRAPKRRAVQAKSNSDRRLLRAAAVPGETSGTNIASRVAALIPVDPDRNGLGRRRSLAEDFFGRPVLQATLERLGRCEGLSEIVLIVPRGFDVDALIDRKSIGRPVVLERCDGSPFCREHAAIASARLWAESCWRGGIAGMSIYDEVLCPQVMSEIMTRRGITAALLAGPDWPLLDPSPESGCDAVIARHLEDPVARTIVFTQAPPGLCGCIVSASFMADLAKRNRLATIGGRLIYQPHLPQLDPIGKAANVQIDHGVRNSLIRATFDSPRQCALLRQSLQSLANHDEMSAAQAVIAIERVVNEQAHPLPRHVILDLTPQRSSYGLFAPDSDLRESAKPIPRELSERILTQLAESEGSLLTLGCIGDPLLHPEFDAIISRAKDAGIGIHVRTELRAEKAVLDRLLNSGADVISVDLYADRAATYTTMVGKDDFRFALENIEYCVENRQRFTDNSGTAALALPWIVPRLQRRAETYEDIESFFDRWQHVLGTAVLEPVPELAGDTQPTDTLLKPDPPKSVIQRELRSRMMILSDGSVPVCETDVRAKQCVGSAADCDLGALWAKLQARRHSLHGGKLEASTLRP